LVWSAAALPFSLSSPKKEERAGERRPFFVSFPSLQLSPLVPRGERGRNALSVFQAEHNWKETPCCNSKFATRTRPAGDSAGVNLSFPATLAWPV